MAGPVDRTSRLPPYSGTLAGRLRLATAVALALGAGGCAMSHQFGSLFGKQDRDDASAYASADDVTGSIRSAPAAGSQAAALPPERDLAYARAALVDVLTRGGKDTSAPWENPRSGARGTVTPIAAAYDLNGITCRDFLASHVHLSAESWMRGEACRAKKGKWEVKTLRPWTRS